MLSPELMENIGRARDSKKVLLLDHGIILPLTNEQNKSIGVIYIESSNLGDGIKLLEYIPHRRLHLLIMHFCIH